jgi:hypothetical protein
VHAITNSSTCMYNSSRDHKAVFCPFLYAGMLWTATVCQLSSGPHPDVHGPACSSTHATYIHLS